jgi:hypothetical protein
MENYPRSLEIRCKPIEVYSIDWISAFLNCLSLLQLTPQFYFCLQVSECTSIATQKKANLVSTLQYRLFRMHSILSLHGSTALLLDLGQFFSFLILYTVCRTLWKGDQPVARLLPTHRINAHRNPCLEWDSNPLFQCSSRRRRFMTYTAWPLLYTVYFI